MQENNLVAASQPYMTLQAVNWPMNIVFHHVGTLQPKDDITPKEAVQLCMMLACSWCGSGVDYPAFVKENHLERHFANQQSI